MTDSTGAHPNLPVILLFLALAVCILCACCVVGGSVITLYLLRPASKPTPGIATLPTFTRMPTVWIATETISTADTPTPEAVRETPKDGMDSDPDSWRTTGDPAAPVLVEEFGDFQCPFCGRFHDQSEKRLREEYIDTGKVRFVFRNYIVIDGFISGGKESRQAALGALCAGAQGKFWEYHDLLFENQSGENEGAFAVPNLLSFASGLDIAEDPFQQCLQAETYAFILEADDEAADQNGIDGVPAFLINGDVMVGFQGEDFFEALDEALADAE